MSTLGLCPTCDGTGTNAATGRQTNCRECGGTGTDTPPRDIWDDADDARDRIKDERIGL